MKPYRDLVEHVLDHGEYREDRTGTGTLSVFGHQMRFDLREGFPLLGAKRTHFHSIKAELLWFLKGSTNVKWLQEQGVTIWDEWADEDGDLGPVYGKQWRWWPSSVWDECWDDYVTDVIDQIADVIESIKTDPYSRRHIVSAWNPAEVEDMALPPCHMMFQFYVSKNGELSCHLYQRSADIFLGVPFNIASYALLTHMVAQVTGLRVGEFVHTLGDAHIYSNHIDGCLEMLGREERPAPELVLNTDVTDIDSFTMNDIMVVGYDPHPAIKGKVAV